MRLLVVFLVWATFVFAGGKDSAVTGVWRAEMNGLPALVMTLSDEGGGLTGAVLFYLIRRNQGQPAQSSPGIPEPMFNLRFEGTVLDFRVSHRRAHLPQTAHDPPVSFRLKITAANEGLLVREADETGAIRVVRDR